jgi:DNA-binding beta-propeller fold protein YncE
MRRRSTMRWVLLAACGLVLMAPAGLLAKDYLYVPVIDGLQVVDCDTDTVVKTVPMQKDYVCQSAFSPDGKRYYLSNFDVAYAFDTATDALLDTYRFSHPLSLVTVFGFAVSQDGTKLLLSCTIAKKKHNIPRLNVLPPQLVIYDLKKKQVDTQYEIPYGVTSIITLRNDPDQVVLLGRDAFRFSLKTGKLEKVLSFFNPEKGEEPKNSFVVWNNCSPGDHGIFTVPYYTATGMGYTVIDRNTGEVRTLKGKDVWMIYSTLVSPDKRYMYGIMDELVKIDFETGETVKSVPITRGTCYAVALTADGKKVYVGPAGNDLSVYDTSTLELLKVIPLSGDGAIVHRISR